METGILAHTFERPNLGRVLDAVAESGLKAVQYHIFIDGQEVLPESYTESFCAEIAEAFSSRGVTISAISGLFNTIHPDIEQRLDGIRRCQRLIEHCPALNASFVTLCSGTRCPDDMWTYHRDNADPSAWRDLVDTLERLLPVAELHHVQLGIEPEQANVITTAALARKLLDQLGSNNLKIIMDGANLLKPLDFTRMHDIMTEAFDLLGDDIGLAHAKDFAARGITKRHPAAGEGSLDWDTYIGLLCQSPYDGPIILHNLVESQVPKCVRFIENLLPGRKSALCDKDGIAVAAFQHDEITFHFEVRGEGQRFVFSHGLGWDLYRSQDLLGHLDGQQLITWDMRAHGKTTPTGPAENLSFQTFASDKAALMDHLHINRAVVGGISMGAAVALQFAADHPVRVAGLVLLQPTWSPIEDSPHLTPFIEIADLLDQFGAEGGQSRFEKTTALKELLASAPDAAASLVGQFRKPQAAERSIRLRIMPKARPLGSWAGIDRLRTPTLVIGTRNDPIHPLACAEQWARNIPGARLLCVMPRSSDPKRYVQEVGQEVQRFLSGIANSSPTTE